ncbi:MAG: ABC transporter permease [Thermotogae bacterium]|nr:ABC transporter permease [Thermotogota bacterium]
MNKNRKAEKIIIKGFLKKSRNSFRLSFFSILIGVWGIVAITSIINGFDSVLMDSITNFYPHITVLGNYTENNNEISEKFKFDLENNLAVTRSGFQFIQVLNTEKTDFFSKSLEYGDFSGAVIGNELSKELGVTLGDEINFFSVKGILPVPKKYKISGIFKTNVYNYDSKIALIQKTEDLTYTGIILRNPKNAEKFKKDYLSAYNSLTWKESNETLTKTVEVDSLITLLISVFVFIMTGFSISNSVTFSILNRKKEIGILKSIGFGKTEISSVFLRESIYISLYGYLAGLSAGVLTSLILKIIKIKLPGGIFYIDYLPVNLDIKTIIFSFFLNFFVVSLFSFFTAYRILKIETLEALKNEE